MYYYNFMQDCGVGAAVFGWRWLLLYAASNTKISSRALLCDRPPDNFRTEGTVPERTPKPKPVVLSPIIHTSGQMMTPVIKGPSPTLPTMAATHLALRTLLLPPIYIPQLSHANRHVFQTQHSTPLHLSPPPRRRRG